VEARFDTLAFGRNVPMQKVHGKKSSSESDIFRGEMPKIVIARCLCRFGDRGAPDVTIWKAMNIEALRHRAKITRQDSAWRGY
jgi:hypothetical protein